MVDTVGWIVGISVSQSVSSSSSSVVVDFVGRTVIDPDPVEIIVGRTDVVGRTDPLRMMVGTSVSQSVSLSSVVLLKQLTRHLPYFDW